jgi:hypothetical protein
MLSRQRSSKACRLTSFVLPPPRRTVRADPVDTEDTEPEFEATAIHKAIQGRQ